MGLKKTLIYSIILFVIICAILIVTVPEEFGYWSHKVISFITFGLI